MQTYVALLRAVNVGGTGKLAMADLREMCERVGFINVRTYIASGNVVFASASTATEVQTTLEEALAAYAEKPVGVVVLTPDEMAATHTENPFADREPSQTMAIFLNAAPSVDGARQGDRSAERGPCPRPTGDLCALRRGDGRVQTEDPGCRKRYGSEYEHRRCSRAALGLRLG